MRLNINIIILNLDLLIYLLFDKVVILFIITKNKDLILSFFRRDKL